MTSEKSGGGESVTGLHARWRAILDGLDKVPGCPTPRREARLIEAERLEREIGRTPARDTEEIVLKLRIALSGRTAAALSDSALLAGAIEDLERMGGGRAAAITRAPFEEPRRA